MKKYVVLCVCFVLLSFSSVRAQESPKELPDVKIIIDSEQKAFTDIPILVNGSTLLPLRQLLTYLGIQNDDEHIIWNQEEKSVTIKQGDAEIYLKVYDNKALVNGTEIILNAASTLYKGRTYIPVRFVAEALKKKVTWDGNYPAVYIGEEDKYNQVKLVMDKVLAQTNDLKDISYNVQYDFDIKLEGNIPNEISKTTEKHIGSDIIECDLTRGVTHYKLGVQTGASSRESTLPLVEEGYYTKDFCFTKYKGYKWIKSEFTDTNTFSYSTEIGSKTPRSSQIVLNNLNGVIDDIQYAGFKINSELSNESETVLEGDIFSNYIINKISSILTTGELGAQASMAMLFGGHVKSSALNMEIVVDNKSNTVKKIEFTPLIIYEIQTDTDSILITLSGQITHDYSYNKGLVINVPDEVIMNSTNGELLEEISSEKN